MPFNSIGDLASSLILSQSNMLAKRNLQKFSTELVTGVTSNIKSVLQNDMSRQVQWQRSLASNSVLSKTLSEALTQTQSKRLVINSIENNTASFANQITTSLASNSSSTLESLSKNALNTLDQTLSQLNSEVAGRSLFSGSSTDTMAIASSEVLLQSVKAYVAPSITPSGITQKVREWMDDRNSGFESVAYFGSDDDPSPIRISEDRQITEASKANHPAIKKVIESLFLATISSDENLGLATAERATLLSEASTGLRDAGTQLIQLEAGIGYIEGELQKAKTTVSSEIATTEQIRADVLGVDEFEIASRLQSTELQLEKIYTVTARASRMSLLEYLR